MSAALVALWLVPQSLFADCRFTPQVFVGQEADRTELEVDATIHVGDGGLGQANITAISSTDQNVVKAYDAGRSNYYVFGIAAGEATVTYTESGMDGRTPCSTEHVINYTVEKGIPTLYFAGGDGSAVTEYTAAWSQSSGGGDETGGGISAGGGVTTGGADGESSGGSSVWTPSCYARYQVLTDVGGGNYRMVSTAIPTSELTFNSTNSAVASINANGQTTVNGLGTTVISAHWNGNANWAAADAQYTLNVKKQASIYFSPSNITDTVDNVVKLNVVCPEGVTVNRWESMSTTVATVDNDGNVTLHKVGQVMIRAYSDGNDEYAPAVCACQINIVKRIPNIHFSKSYVEVEYGVTPYDLPELSKPADLNTSLYHWRLSNNNVAYINTNTGALDIFATGNVQVYYYSESNADPKYEPTAASYALRVTTSGVYVNGTLVTSNNPDVLGDGSMMYSVEPGVGKFLTFNNLDYTGTGGTFIEANEPLNILVKGSCSISGVAYAIHATSSVFLWCENNKDSISINAQYVAINAGSTKVHDCYLFATAGLYAISTQTGISVSAGGYIFAQATGQNIGGKSGTPEAIRANHFIKGEASIGGIEVLTKGVTFVEGLGEPGTGGFFTNYAADERATFVEIGKVPLPLLEDEVKDINFESTDPHNNLDVVFSESEDDTFNETTREIELSTTTEDDAVAGAVELYVTCSSEWLKLLPGVLVFDVPAGKGEAEIECTLNAGYQLVVKIEGKGTVVFTTTEDGKIKIEYDIIEQTHVIVYLQPESGASGAPKRIAKAKKDAAPGAAIKSIKITPKGTTTGIDDVQGDNVQDTKYLREGQLFIIRDGKVFNANGQQLR